jgi:hypothetical protein
VTREVDRKYNEILLTQTVFYNLLVGKFITPIPFHIYLVYLIKQPYPWLYKHLRRISPDLLAYHYPQDHQADVLLSSCLPTTQLLSGCKTIVKLSSSRAECPLYTPLDIGDLEIDSLRKKGSYGKVKHECQFWAGNNWHGGC